MRDRSNIPTQKSGSARNVYADRINCAPRCVIRKMYSAHLKRGWEHY